MSAWPGRYNIMRDIADASGTLGVEMMKRTATVQANLDYVAEAEWWRRCISSGWDLQTALYCASSLVDGKPSESTRAIARAAWLTPTTIAVACCRLCFWKAWLCRLRRVRAGCADVLCLSGTASYHPAGGMTFRRFHSASKV